MQKGYTGSHIYLKASQMLSTELIPSLYQIRNVPDKKCHLILYTPSHKLVYAELLEVVFFLFGLNKNTSFHCTKN